MRCLILLTLAAAAARAQGSYEVQVYGSESVPRGKTMLEFHANYTVRGSTATDDGTRPTNHQFHGTWEVTRGWRDWFETGFYVFTSAGGGGGWEYAGSHIRPRVRAPDSWHLPVGLSLSAEFGYQRPLYSADTWTLELRPIVDKQVGRAYLCFNPTLGRTFHGPSVAEGVVLSPNFKASYGVFKRVSFGLEYYGSLGRIPSFAPFRDQQQMFIPVMDIDFGEDWEFNFGAGVGATSGTDHLLLKMIAGRRFSFGRRARKPRG
ncbi:MAG: hypothetical protein HY858_12675 [Candidatus Solibacter usitatus]|nr:hypothetical protein [Candidatus Solibacter usitatus]